jgi:hypothetical protein
MKFRKKPVVIEAVQYTRKFVMPSWLMDAVIEERVRVYNTGNFQDPTSECFAVIATLEGDMTVNENDWIIRGIKGELYPCKPDIFEMTYEPA